MRAAEHGEKALAILHELRTEPCLVLVDMMMPVMSGPELLQALHETHRLASLPIVIVSAAVSESDAISGARRSSRSQSPRRSFARSCTTSAARRDELQRSLETALSNERPPRLATVVTRRVISTGFVKCITRSHAFLACALHACGVACTPCSRALLPRSFRRATRARRRRRHPRVASSRTRAGAQRAFGRRSRGGTPWSSRAAHRSCSPAES